MKVTVVGTGYVGLVSGICLAELGHDVIGMDIDTQKVQRLQSGELPIYEPGLEQLLTRNLAAGRLQFTTDLGMAASQSEVIFLALPTPPNDDGSADISRTLSVLPVIGGSIANGAIIVNKSTVPVGTTQKIREALAKHTQATFDVVSNPEFLREGSAVDDFMQPATIVIGVNSDEVGRKMATLYQPLISRGAILRIMDEHSAEVAKYAMNTMLAARISLMNELANVCERVGADIEHVRQVLAGDSRIGSQFLSAGIGYGGSCFPKDVRALINTAAAHGYDMPMTRAIVSTNAAQRQSMVNKITTHFDGDISGKTFAVWGLAFKPHTDDLRESPALDIIDGLVANGANIQAFDPAAAAGAKARYNDSRRVTICRGQYDALTGADALILATEWPEFSRPDFVRIKKALRRALIFDGRNVYDLAELRKLGFMYVGVGRGTSG